VRRRGAIARNPERGGGRTCSQRAERACLKALAIEDRPAVAAFLRAHAPFDHLVLPGSTVKPLAYEELSDANAREAFDSKFWGPFWAAYDARPWMRRGGSVVFFSGVAAERPVKGYVLGACINGALNAAVRSLALEFGPLRPPLQYHRTEPHRHPPDTLHAHDKESDTRLAARLPVGRTAPRGGGWRRCS
jgi:NAD(P)-dependent dehydrogenase (short-subunit alcohol dehydrogenase family)